MIFELPDRFFLGAVILFKRGYIMANKTKKAMFTAAVAAMTFGGGYGLAKHSAKTEKEQLKSKVETAFNNQISANNKEMSAINTERYKLHLEAQHIIADMIRAQNDTANKQLDDFFPKAYKSFTKTEIAQLKEEFENSIPNHELYDLSQRDLAKWAINIDGDINTARAYMPYSEYHIVNTPIKYKALGVKRRALRKEWDKIKSELILDDGEERNFMNTVAVFAKGDTAKLYSYIMQDFAEYYNHKKNKIEYWEEEYERFPNGGMYNVSGYRTRIGKIGEIEFGFVPDFNLPEFKKQQKKLEIICKRLQELEKRELALQQTANLKTAVFEEFSR